MTSNQQFEKTKLPNIKNIIMVASGKGGVGKSTVAAGLALSLSLEGYLVGLFDADIYGPSIPTLFNLMNEYPIMADNGGNPRIEPFTKFGVKVMSIGFFITNHQPLLWRGPAAASGLIQLMNDTDWGELDYLIIDTPPGTGDIHLTLLQQYEIDGAIVVTTPQNMALTDVQKAIGMFLNEHVGVPVLGIAENMAWFTPSLHPDEKYCLFGNGGGEFLANEFEIPLLAQIPLTERLCESCDEGKLQELLADVAVKEAFDQLLNGILKQQYTTNKTG
jgi:ATP-binding protein involved in chromosome partitioning